MMAMTEQELREKQEELMRERELWEEKKSDNLHDKAFIYYCDTQMQKLDDECDDIRRTLYEMGCDE